MRTEKILWTVFLAGLILKFIPVTVAGFLLTISLGTIAILYFPTAFYFFSDKDLKRQRLPLSIVSGLFLSLIPIGILFKLQYWPGGHLQLLLGTVSAPIILAITYFLKSKAADNLKMYYKNLFQRTTILCVLSIIFYFTPTATIINIQYRNDPELARLKTLAYTNPDNQEYRQQLDNYIMHRDSLQQSKTK